jgi:ADP-ribosylglycohydrolase
VDPIDRARQSLEGLSVGDAFGENFFGLEERWIETRALPRKPWRYTDDTEMALSIFEMLRTRRSIDQDELAQAFAKRMNPNRGYGANAYQTLTAIQRGGSWRESASGAFRGKGSFGNGAAMRVAPLGAFFADDIERCVGEARQSAEITHTHPEGIAGAIAVAVAAALTVRRYGAMTPNGRTWLDEVRSHVPDGLVRKGIEKALRLPAATTTENAALALGNGCNISAPDTVPFCLWIASWHSHRYEEALWQTVSVGGDLDTTSAIVGGIVALQSGGKDIPEVWRERREPLPIDDE